MGYIIKGAPFRYRGAKNVEDCKTAEDVMVKAHLDWEVAKCELVAKMPIKSVDEINGSDDAFMYGGELYRDCPNAYATYRTDTNTPLGLVKSKYTPVQNVDAFNFFNKAIGKDKAIWQTAGYFGNGERIFVSAKLPKNILVGNDPIENYLVFTTSHDGSNGVKILFTPIRVVCENTLNAAIQQSENYVSFRHTKSVHDNIDIADEILGICNTKINYLSDKFTAMSKTKINDVQLHKFFADVVLTDDEKNMLNVTGHNPTQIIMRNWQAMQDAGISSRKANAMAEMNSYYFDGFGQREYVGTAWGAYNAVTGYYSNIDKIEGINRMDSILFGSKAKKIELAGNYALTM